MHPPTPPVFLTTIPPPPISTLFPYTTLFRSQSNYLVVYSGLEGRLPLLKELTPEHVIDLRSEEHTSELQSQFDLVCRLLREKKNQLGTCGAVAPGVERGAACGVASALAAGGR